MVPHSRNFVVCVDLNEDQKHDDDDDPFFTQNHQVEAVSSFSSLSHPFKPPDQGSSYYSWGKQPPSHHHHHHHHEKGEKIIIGSSGHGSLLLSRDHHQDGSSSSSSSSSLSSVKWLPSKKRILIRNMMTMDQKAGSSYIAELGKGGSNYSVDKYYFEDQQQRPLSSSPPTPPLIAATTVTVRVCSDCHTTKTPLWRSGPCGPKSLCNACGIRQRKARRAAAMAAAAEANGGGTMMIDNNPVAAESVKGGGNKSNNKKSKMEQLKKKRKLIGVGSKQPTHQGDNNNGRNNKLGFEDLKLMSFPHDEIEIKEAAILLMALSYGHLVLHG